MKNSKNRLIAKIQGEEYIICSESSLEHLKKVVQKVDNIMSELAEKHPRISTQKLAILTALNMADRLIKLEEGASLKSKKKKAR
ncbi:MAG: cell division protein ZapA [Firmicutes bacterium]|jgi:cell division protein ZapA|nr:cell division protein ZapA [Bacillota bacterium]